MLLLLVNKVCCTLENSVFYNWLLLYFVAAMVTVPDDPRFVIVQKLAVIVEGQPDMELDLTRE